MSRRALSDRFADPSVIERALLKRGKEIRLEQRTKAESDIAVAAASILARNIDWLDRHGKTMGMKLARGVSAQVKEAASKWSSPTAGLRRLAKVHFRTAHEIAPGAMPPGHLAPLEGPGWVGRFLRPSFSAYELIVETRLLIS